MGHNIEQAFSHWECAPEAVSKMLVSYFLFVLKKQILGKEYSKAVFFSSHMVSMNYPGFSPLVGQQEEG